MLKAAYNVLTKVKLFTFPSSEDGKSTEGAQPTFFSTVDLFIRQIHPMMDLVEELTDEEDRRIKLDTKEIAIRTVQEERDPELEQVQKLASRYFYRDERITPSLEDQENTEISSETQAPSIINFSLGPVIESTDWDTKYISEDHFYRSYFKYNGAENIDDMKGWENSNLLYLGSSVHPYINSTNYYFDSTPFYFHLSIKDVFDAESDDSDAKVPQKTDSIVLEEVFEGQTKIAEENTNQCAEGNQEWKINTEHKSAIKKWNFQWHIPFFEDILTSNAQIPTSSGKLSLEGKNEQMTTILRSDEQAMSDTSTLAEEPKTIKAKAYAWGKFLYAVPYSSYSFVTGGTQSIAKETGRQIGLTINALGAGFWEGLTSSKREVIEDSQPDTSRRSVSTIPPPAAYRYGIVVRETLTHFSDGALGKEHGASFKKTYGKKQSLDQRAHVLGSQIRSAGIHTVKGMLGIPVKQKKQHALKEEETIQRSILGSHSSNPSAIEEDLESEEISSNVTFESHTLSSERLSLARQDVENDDVIRSDPAVVNSDSLSSETTSSCNNLDELSPGEWEDIEEVMSDESSDEEVEAEPRETLSTMLTSMSEWIKSGVKVKATSLMLDALGYALKQAYSNSQDRAVKDQINDMIEEVEDVKGGKGNFDRLRSTLTKIMNGQNTSGTQVRNMLQLHLQGIFEIPIRENVAEDITSRQILMQNIEAIPDTRSTASINYKREIPKVQNRLVKNITALSSLQAANQLILKNALSNEMISEILQGSDRENSNYLENIKKRFYREVDRLDVTTFQKIASKLLYAIVDFSTSFSLQRFISSLIKKVEALAVSSSTQRTQEQHNKIFKHTNDFLCVLKGTLKRVKSNPEPTANVQTMTEMELSQPKFNHGFTKERLYSEVCFKAIEEIFPPLGWTEDFLKGQSKQNIAIRTAKSLLTPFVWLSEFICNRIIKSILHIVLSKSNIIEIIIDKSLNQVSRNGYTHSINKIFYEQLRLMWIEMHNQEQRAEELDPSIANKEELRDFIINLYDVLELNRQSRHALGESTILERTKESLYKMSTDYSAEAIALLINKAKNTFLKPDLVPMREYTMMEALNASLESRSTDSEEEMVQLEQDIVQIRDAILSKAIRTVVHKSFDSGPTSTEKAFEKISTKLSNILTRNIEIFKANLNQENKKQLMAGIRDCSRAILDLQRLVEDDPAVRSESTLFYNFYTTPISKMLAKLRTSAMSNEQKDKKKAIISSMQVWLEEMPKVKHINSASLPSLSSTVEGAANWIALKAGKEFFDEAWSLMRKPYIWRYGVVHRTLIPFVESH